MDALLKETVDAAINSRYPGMAPEGRRLIEEILIRKEVEKGALLLNEGQISHNIVFVGKGMLRQFYYKNGKDVTEHFSYEGWRFETARERYNQLMEHQPEVIKRAPLSHIASYLLMTPETLSRVRSGIL